MKTKTILIIHMMGLCLIFTSCSSTRSHDTDSGVMTGGNLPTPVDQPGSDSVGKTLAIKELGTDNALVLFSGYQIEPGGNPNFPDPETWTIQLTWGEVICDQNTRIIRYGGYYHGFRIGPLRKEVDNRLKGRFPDHMPDEIWILTINKKGGIPIKLEMNEISVVPDDYAILEIIAGPQKGKNTGKLYEGSVFTANGKSLLLKRNLRDATVVKEENGNETLLEKRESSDRPTSEELKGAR